METKENLGKTIFNLQRFQVLYTKLNPQTADLISDAAAYAWYNKIFPFLHDSDTVADLGEYFDVSEEKMNELHKYVCEEIDKGKYHTFRHYRTQFSKFGINLLFVKMGLIDAFRYYYLCGQFDDEFYKVLLSDASSEAMGLNSEFKLTEISLL